MLILNRCPHWRSDFVGITTLQLLIVINSKDIHNNANKQKLEKKKIYLLIFIRP